MTAKEFTVGDGESVPTTTADIRAGDWVVNRWLPQATLRINRRVIFCTRPAFLCDVVAWYGRGREKQIVVSEADLVILGYIDCSPPRKEG